MLEEKETQEKLKEKDKITKEANRDHIWIQ